MDGAYDLAHVPAGVAAGNVVALPGHSVPRRQAEPIPEVVEICEGLLRRAKDGTLRGVAAALVIGDPQLRTRTEVFAGPSPDRYVMVAAIRNLDHNVSKLAFDDQKDDE